MIAKARPGYEARRVKGWFGAHKWLLARRASQAAAVGLFLSGPWFGLWILKGSLAASLFLDTVPMTDPLILLQSLAAGHALATTALIGAAVVVALYAVAGGRAYCAWVCPVNLLTDFAYWQKDEPLTVITKNFSHTKNNLVFMKAEEFLSAPPSTLVGE